MIEALALLAGYLCGSVPFGVVIAKLRGVDLTKVGSGNIGATNAARALGKTTGILVLILDAAKAYVPIVVARTLLRGRPDLDWLLAGIGLCAFLGHVFPVWLRFRGGKGVASGLGVFFALAPLAALLAGALWLLMYAVTRTSSIGSLVAATALVPFMMWRHEPLPYLLLAGALYLFIVWRHRGNIARLVRRQETKV